MSAKPSTKEHKLFEYARVEYLPPGLKESDPQFIVPDPSTLPRRPARDERPHSPIDPSIAKLMSIPKTAMRSDFLKGLLTTPVEQDSSSEEEELPDSEEVPSEPTEDAEWSAPIARGSRSHSSSLNPLPSLRTSSYQPDSEVSAPRASSSRPPPSGRTQQPSPYGPQPVPRPVSDSRSTRPTSSGSHSSDLSNPRRESHPIPKVKLNLALNPAPPPMTEHHPREGDPPDDR